MSLRIVMNFASREPEPVSQLPAAPSGYFWGRVLHDDEKNEKFREGLPETVKLYDDHAVELTAVWQNYLFEMLRAKRPNWTHQQLVNAWADLTENGKAFTDYSAVQNGRADYIQNINTDAEGIGWHTIVCGGNTVLLSNQIFTKGGEQCHHIVTMDGTNNPGRIVIWNGAGFVGQVGTLGVEIVATTRSRETTILDGRTVHIVNPFPQLIENGTYKDVPVLLISNRPNFIRTYQVVALTDSIRPSPYVPAREYS